MSFRAVTTYSDKQWEGYARRCVETFKEFWLGMSLFQFTDRELEEQSDWLAEFKKRHADKPTDNYKFDAVRFAHKVAAIELAYLRLPVEVNLVWVDADVVTHSQVTTQWLHELLDGADFAYLARKNKYPECGFMIFKNNSRCLQMIRHITDLYREDTLFKLKEWHDSFAIEHVRSYLSEWGALACVSLSGEVESGHPFVNGPLGSRMDHLKGKRKLYGKSHKVDLKVRRKEAYWL